MPSAKVLLRSNPDHPSLDGRRAPARLFLDRGRLALQIDFLQPLQFVGQLLDFVVARLSVCLQFVDVALEAENEACLRAVRTLREMGKQELELLL